MKSVTFKGYKVSELNFINKMENGSKIEFENKFSYNVKYSQNNTCVGEMTVEISSKEFKDKFAVKLVLMGIFTYNPETKKEVLHVETFKELFPYARNVISTTSVNAGIPPIYIPYFDIESQSIYKFGRNC